MSNVCFVLFLRLLTWKPGWERPVDTLIQFSSTAGVSTWVSFVIWCRLVPSGLLNTLVSFSFPRTLVLRGSLLMRGRATDIFLRPPSGPLITGEGLCHVEFQAAPQDAQNWFAGSADIKNAFHQMRIPGWVQAFFFFFTLHCFRIRSWLRW